MSVPEKLTFEEAAELTERLYKRLDARRKDIDDLENSYEGKRNLQFATDAWMEANADRYAFFSDNWCATVSDAENERIQVNGIILPTDRDIRSVATDEKQSRDPEAEALWDQWLRNECDMQSSQGFLQALNTRRCYIMVWGDEDGEPVITWEHPSNVEIEYDWMTGRKRLAGIKSWVDEDYEYSTLYTRTEVWKFQRDRAGKPEESASQIEQRKIAAGATGDWQERQFRSWEDDVAYGPNPLEVMPIVELPNRPRLRGEPVSEIEKVGPLQDAINLLWSFALFAADYASMDARIITGANPPMRKRVSAEGKELPPEPITMAELNEARMMVLSDPNAKIDSWKAAALTPFTDMIDVAVSHIAAQSRTPPHYLVAGKGMSNMAADALKAAEIGLVKKVQEFELPASAALREVFSLIARVQKKDKLAEAMRLATISWANPEQRSESQLADALLKKRQMGYPFEWILEKDGVDPSDRARILEMKTREEQATARAALAGAMTGAYEDDGFTGDDSDRVPAGAGGSDGSDDGGDS